MAIPPSKVAPLTFNVPIADPKTGHPTPQFSRLLQQLVTEKQAAAQTAADALPTSNLLSQLMTDAGGDPGADALFWWDHANNTFHLLKLGTNLSISAGVLNAAGGGGGGGNPWYFKPPLAANFSTMYAALRGGSLANAVTVADDAQVGMTYTDPSTDNGYIKAFGRPIPAAYVGGNFTITAHIKANSISANDQFGIWARCSSSKYVFFDVFNRGGSVNLQRCYYNGAWNDGTYSAYWETNEVFLRLAIANQTTSYFASIDGKNWIAVYPAENLLAAPFTDYGFCIGRFTLTHYNVTVDMLQSDEFP